MVNATIINAMDSLANVTNAVLNVSSQPKILSVLSNQPLMLFAISALTVTVILIVVVRNVIPVSQFIYSNARMSARSGYMVSDNLLVNITEAKSLREFVSLLRQTEYEEATEKAKDDLISLHAALEQAFINSICELVELSPKKSKQLFNAYLMFFEAKILKIFFRARFMKTGFDENLVYPIGSIDNNILKHLLETKTAADIGVVMSSTTYASIFERNYSTLEEFEVNIDKFVFNNFTETIKKAKMYDGKHIIDIMNTKIDISNITAILKFRVRGIEKEKQKGLLIENGTDVCKRFERLISAATIKEFAEGFKGTLYYGAMMKALEGYEKDDGMLHFENELYRFFRKFIADNELSHTLGPYPLFSYLIKKEMELRNLYVISKGIDGGFTPEKIKEMTV